MILLTINELLQILLSNEKKSKKTINMVPSENFASAFSRLPLLLDLYNRYFFNVDKDPHKWNFRGAQDVADIEAEVAIPLLRELGQAKHVNLRPISGLNCMAMVLRALGGGTGSEILLVSPDQGGHYATKDLAESFGLRVHFITGPDPHTVDWTHLAETLRQNPIKLVYIDQSNCLFPLDAKELVRVVREVSPETIVHLDVSHWMGLVFGKQMDNPLQIGADSYGGSTHKTFPGPQRALFFTNRDDLQDIVKQTQFYMLSSHHFGTVAALALSLMEFKENGGSEYAARVVDNSKLLAATLHACGFDVKGKEYGFTCGHQVWMSTNNVGIDSFVASERLYQAGIRVNVFDDLPGSQESIMRLGVNEFTRFGAVHEDVLSLAEIMNDAIRQKKSVSELQERVGSLRTKYQHPFTYNLQDEKLSPLVQELIQEALALTDLLRV